MAFTAKRILSGFLALWFTAFSVLLPVASHAATYNASGNFTGRVWAVPLQGTGLAGAPIAAAAATILTRANPWIAGISIGTALVQTLVEIKNGTPGSTVGLRTFGQLYPTIPGWENPNSPPLTVPPTTGTTTRVPASVAYVHSNCPKATGTTPLEACAAVTTCGYQVGRTATLVESSACHYYSASPYYDSNWGTALGTLTCPEGGTRSGNECLITSTCPSGYALTSGTCQLTDSPKVQWPSDGVATYVPRVGDNGVYSWWPSERDPDQGTYLPSNLQTPAAINQALQSPDIFTDPDGNAVTQSFTPTTDGGYQLRQSIQHAGATQTYTTTNILTVNNAGNVTNISTVTNNGPITANNSGSAPAVVLPTDYSRESTQKAIQTDVNKLATGQGAQDAPDFKKDVEDKKTAMDKGITDFTDAIPGQFAESKGNWFSWVWSPPVGVCTPYQGSIHGKSVSWNICPYIANVRDVIGWLFALYGAWVVYNQMFKREDA